MEAYYKESRLNLITHASTSGKTFSNTTNNPVNLTESNSILPNKLCFLSGYKQDGWKDLIKRSIGATTVCDGENWSASIGDLRIKSNVLQHFLDAETSQRGQSLSGHFQLYGWPFINIGTAPADVMSRVRNRVIAKFISKCNDARSVIESGQDIGEYKQTLESIHSPLSSMRKKMLSYLNTLSGVKKKRGRISLPRALADSYLELHFGVGPLVDDVAKLATECGSYHFNVQRVSAKAQEIFTGANGIEDVTTYMIAGDPLQAYSPIMGYQENSIYQMQYKGAIRTGADPNGTISRVQELQLLPRNWLPTAWDLLPYSWIADYFINIGEIISGLSFVYSDLVWGNSTARIQRRREYSNMGLSNPRGAFPPDPNWVDVKHDVSSGSDNSVFEAHSFHREPLNPSDLLATVETRVPTSPWAFGNMAALLVQRASKIVPFL